MLELVCVCIYCYDGRTWYLVAIAIAKVVLPSLHRGIVEFDILVCLTLAFDTLQDTAHYTCTSLIFVSTGTTLNST